MDDIAHELKVRPAAAAHNNRITVLDDSYILLSPQERDEAVAEIERLRGMVADDTGKWQDLWKGERAANERLRALLQRYQVANYIPEDCDLYAETQAILNEQSGDL